MTSPFHRGEQMIQSMLGIRDRMENFGSRVIRDYMPLQHRDFYQKLPFLFAGHADENGWPWASIICGKPGFVTSPEPKILVIENGLLKGDPLRKVFSSPRQNIGFLGIELPTRRRNRISMEVVESTNNKTMLLVKQAFGNCPQYIQARATREITPPPEDLQTVTKITSFSLREKNLITAADTFFVASYVNDSTQESSATQGADVSHRGGKPGFVSVNGNTLTIPDYPGNGHFNTFGNIMLNKKAGLLFIDFETGDILTITGTAEILWDETSHFPGAERTWTFKLDHGWYCEKVLPFRFEYQGMSRETQETGTWKEAHSIKALVERSWATLTVSRVVEESSTVRSVYFTVPTEVKDKYLDFKAGQFLTLRANIEGHGVVVRTYTVSSSFADEQIRISVKLDKDGLFSKWVHQQVHPNMTVEAKAPTGAFSLDRNQTGQKKILLIAGGIGITPMVSIIRQQVASILYELRSKESFPEIQLLYSSRDDALLSELIELQQRSLGLITVTFFDTTKGNRITVDVIKTNITSNEEVDAYICGPTGFMQAMYNNLRMIGVAEEHIFAEEFGPATIKRDSDPEPVEVASSALVQFEDSQMEQQWVGDDSMTLLDLAESHGLSPNSGCRSGKCGSCKYKLVSGSVVYRTKPLTDIEDSDVLLCCAAPAVVEGDSLPKIVIGGL
eukprot:TRINITY_DN5774_c0_g1_i1.p1 TRINITY_DN5774_c0_g1~~TRINITY_DN5774_c0_g1_i1.p1  ORF type:complete len:674 (+),score=87.18 TRINITY_DN5774_c0_g1_i1:139-2160(+)